MLASYHWPGNVRELANVIERAIVVCDANVVHSHHPPLTWQTAEASGTTQTLTLQETLEAVEPTRCRMRSRARAATAPRRRACSGHRARLQLPGATTASTGGASARRSAAHRHRSGSGRAVRRLRRRGVVSFGGVEELLLFAVAAIAGAINSVAGGGTLLSFPTLLWLGVPSVVANATNTVALWPGSLGSVWGYRRELAGADRRVFALVVPSVIGGFVGAVLLRLTPTERFRPSGAGADPVRHLLFMAQEPIQRRFNPVARQHEAPHWLSEAMLFQFAVGVYGGYFGAGIGILMLAALSLMGHTDIHQMNGVKTLLAICINGVAALYFVFSGLVVWPDALVMAAGAIVGGVGGAGWRAPGPDRRAAHRDRHRVRYGVR